MSKNWLMLDENQFSAMLKLFMDYVGTSGYVDMDRMSVERLTHNLICLYENRCGDTRKCLSDCLNKTIYKYDLFARAQYELTINRERGKDDDTSHFMGSLVTSVSYTRHEFKSDYKMSPFDKSDLTALLRKRQSQFGNLAASLDRYNFMRVELPPTSTELQSQIDCVLSNWHFANPDSVVMPVDRDGGQTSLIFYQHLAETFCDTCRKQGMRCYIMT